MPDDIKPEASLDEGPGGQAGDSPESEGASPQNGTVVVDGAGPDSADVSSEAESGGGTDGHGVVNEGDVPEKDAEAAMLKMLEEDQNAQGGESPESDFPDLSGVRMERPKASPAEFQQISPVSSDAPAERTIEMLLDVKMPVAIELGRTEMPIQDLLTLGPGSVVELNKLAGEPVDLLVNNVLIAKGEVVVVDENFGVRITLLMSPEERLKLMAQQ